MVRPSAIARAKPIVSLGKLRGRGDVVAVWAHLWCLAEPIGSRSDAERLTGRLDAKGVAGPGTVVRSRMECSRLIDRAEDQPPGRPRPILKESAMSRLRQTLAASLLAVAAASAGCAQCTTCADFPAPGYPTGYTSPMGPPITMGPMSPSSDMTSPADASAPAPPAVESKPALETGASGATDSTPPAPQLPDVNPQR